MLATYSVTDIYSKNMQFLSPIFCDLIRFWNDPFLDVSFIESFDKIVNYRDKIAFTGFGKMSL